MTRLDVQLLLLRRCGEFMTQAKMSVESNGDNEHMADPILWALRMLGYTPASIVIVSDAEVEAIAQEHTLAFLDLAELRLLENVRGNLTRVSTSLTRDLGVVESWGQLLTQITAIIKDRTEKIDNMHGSLLAYPLSGGGKRLAALQAV